MQEQLRAEMKEKEDRHRASLALPEEILEKVSINASSLLILLWND